MITKKLPFGDPSEIALSAIVSRHSISTQVSQEFSQGSSDAAITTCPSCGSGQRNLVLGLAEVLTRLPYTRFTSRLVDLAILASEEEGSDE